MKHLNLKLTLLLFLSSVLRVLSDILPPEPGPENAGMRLRLIIASNSDRGTEGYDVHLDLMNVTNRALILRADWRHEGDTGDFRDYLVEAASIETYPAIAPWVGQIMMGDRKSPQPQYVLKAGEILSLKWQTLGRHLNNRVSNPLRVHNPEFSMPGLYSVHATLNIRVGTNKLAGIDGRRNQFENAANDQVLVRSNEQLVSVGGSRQLPKHTFGQLQAADPKRRLAQLSLGALHKIELGDQFEIRTGMTEFWKLTLTRVEASFSEGILEPMSQSAANQSNFDPRFPERGAYAKLIMPK